eukprot:s2607_g7.t1
MPGIGLQRKKLPILIEGELEGYEKLCKIAPLAQKAVDPVALLGRLIHDCNQLYKCQSDFIWGWFESHPSIVLGMVCGMGFTTLFQLFVPQDVEERQGQRQVSRCSVRLQRSCKVRVR